MKGRRAKANMREHFKKKAGRPYEEAVRDLCRAIFPKAKIESGVWVTGPDGRRELDIDIWETVSDQLLHVMIECKDFNRESTGPVGISYIDALDSKSRDLGLHSAFICSNAGYTSDAVRKAKRLGIGLLGATRQGDARIRFALQEEVYIRHVRIAECRIEYLYHDEECANPLGDIDVNQVLFEGRSVVQWLWCHVIRCLTVNPIAQGWIEHAYNFIVPITFAWPSGEVHVRGVTLYVRYEGAWFAQTVTLASSSGLYHHLRRRMQFPQGAWSFRIDGIDLHKGEWVSMPVLSGLDRRKGAPGEFEFNMLVIKNHPEIKNPAFLDNWVRPEDLDPFVDDIGDEMIQSVKGVDLADPLDGNLGRFVSAEWRKSA